MTGKVNTALVLVLLSSCANPYQAARTTVALGRGALELSDIGFYFYLENERTKCSDKCAKAEPCISKCMAPQNRVAMGFRQSKAVAAASLELANAIIDSAEKDKKKEFPDWETAVKKAACVIARLTSFAPPEIKKQIIELMMALARYGCGH